MPKLVEPGTELHQSWLDAHQEWGPGVHEDGFGLFPSDDVISPAGFSAWLARLGREAPGSAAAAADYQCIYRWIIDDDAVVGGITLRYGTNSVLLVCEAGNTASVATIEHNGGVLERIQETEDGPIKRYWIDVQHRLGTTNS